MNTSVIRNKSTSFDKKCNPSCGPTKHLLTFDTEKQILTPKAGPRSLVDKRVLS